jgi:hypothetical protein
MRRIVPIVEGRSEVDSTPAFLRRVLHDRQIFDMEPDRAIREHRQRLARTDVFANRVRMAQYRENCAAIIAVFDADDEAACELGPLLRSAAEATGIVSPCRVVIAVREIEAWLIAGIESLHGYRGVPNVLRSPDDVESIRGAKEWLDSRMVSGYKPTIDQLPLLLKFDYIGARRLAPSLDKFLRDLDSLLV